MPSKQANNLIMAGEPEPWWGQTWSPAASHHSARVMHAAKHAYSYGAVANASPDSSFQEQVGGAIVVHLQHEQLQKLCKHIIDSRPASRGKTSREATGVALHVLHAGGELQHQRFSNMSLCCWPKLGGAGLSYGRGFVDVPERRCTRPEHLRRWACRPC